MDVPAGTTLLPPKKNDTGGATLKPDSWLSDFYTGLTLAGAELGLGIEGLIPGHDVSEKDMDRLDDLRGDYKEARTSGAAVGKIGTEIGEMFIPGMGGTSLLPKLLSKFPMLAKAIKSDPGQDAIRSGMTGLLRDPGEDGSRLVNAGKDVGFSAAGSGVGYAAQGLLRGGTKTPDAEWLESKGIYVSPGKGTGDSMLEGMENIGDVTPFASKGVRQLTAKSDADLRKALFKEANPYATPITEDGAKGVEQLRTSFNNEYRKAWANSPPISVEDANEIKRLTTHARKNLPYDQTAPFILLQKDLEKFAKNATYKGRQQIDSSIGKMVGEAENPMVAMKLNEIRDRLRSKVPADDLARMKQVDKLYPKMLVIENAAGQANKKKGEYGFDQLSSASKTIAERQARGKTGRGGAEFQDYIDAAGTTIGKSRHGEPLSFLRRMSYAAPTSVSAMKGLEPAAYGDTMIQKALLGLIDAGIPNPTSIGPRKFKPSDLVRPGKSATPVGGLLYGDDD